MRLSLLFLISCLASAGAPEYQVPRPPPPKNIQFKVPQIRWWNSAEKARVVSAPVFFNTSEISLGQAKPDHFLMPYPYQGPSSARAHFFYQ